MEGKPKRSRFWLTILIVAVILIILFYFIDLEEVFFILGQTDWRIMLVGAAVLLVGMLINSALYRYILANRPGYREVFHSDGIGYMVTLLSPIPGPAMRVVTTSLTTPVTASRATSGMFIYIIFSMIMRILALMIAILLSSERYTNAGDIALLGIIGLAILIFVIWVLRRADIIMPFFLRLLARFPRINEERIAKTMSELQDALTEVNTYRHILVTLLLAIAMFTCFAVFHYTGFRALPLELSAGKMFALAAATLVILPPSAPATIGVYQGVMVGFLMLFKVADASVLTAYSILVFLVMLVMWIILGVWALLRTDLKLGDLISQTRQFVQPRNEPV